MLVFVGGGAYFFMGWAEESGVIRVTVNWNSSLPFSLLFYFVKDVAPFRSLTHSGDFIETLGDVVLIKGM